MNPILITGAGGAIGSVGRKVVTALRQREFPVRAFVHHEDERAQALRALGAEVVVGDLLHPADVYRAMEGCKRVLFNLSVSPAYLEASIIAAMIAREQKDLEVFVNMSQMTVSQMTVTNMTDSPQQRQHFLSEQVLNWSGLPVVHIRPTVFLENPFFFDLAADSIAKENAIRLPFGNGKTSPIAAADVAEVISTVLAEPSPHIGKIYHLTGPKSETMNDVANEYSTALARPINYVDAPFAQWSNELRQRNLPSHLLAHLLTMAHLHHDNRYDRLTNDVEAITGRPAMSIHDFVVQHASFFSSKQ